MNSRRRFSPEVEALLESSRVVVPLSPAVEARVLARAAATVASTAPWEVAAVPVGFRRAPRWVFAAAAGLMLVMGAAAYAAHAWRRTLTMASLPAVNKRVTVAHVANPAVAAELAPVARDVDEALPRRPSSVRASAVHTRAVSTRPSNAELQLLLRARQAMTSGDFAGALSAVGEHAHRYPSGSLVEEREALRVRSLAGLGQSAEAQRAAMAFHARFPRSVLLSTFDRIGQPSP